MALVCLMLAFLTVGIMKIEMTGAQNIQSEVKFPASISSVYQGNCNNETLGYNMSKTPGDNGFHINILGDPDGYIPGEVYTISLQEYKRHYTIQKFISFVLSVEPKVIANYLNYNNDVPLNVGFFQMYEDGLSKFFEDCPHIIVQTSGIPKSEIQVMWTAPPSMSGCVVFKVKIMEYNDVWYMDDGGLTKELCEKKKQEKQDEEPHITEDCCACQEAKYEVTFEGLWSRHTHPKDFPLSELLPHFSDIIGSSHTADFQMWDYDGFASEGLGLLAKSGTTKKLESELKSESEKIRTIIKARGLWHPNLNGKTYAVFRVDKNHHLVSLLSKVSPSPDWIVGVSALELCVKNCSWVTKKVIDLYPWDAGINDGESYLSTVFPTIPQERIRRITSRHPNSPQSPFFDPTGMPMKPVARLTIARQRIYEKSCDKTEQDERNHPMAEDCDVAEWTSFTPCSVTCGRGIQMRTRNFINKQDARKTECFTKLTEKRYCDVKCERNISCETSNWSDWTTCSVTCGIGSRSRRRNYLNTKAFKICRKDLLEQRSCSESISCEKNSKCAIFHWSEWSPCTSSCGEGTKFRIRLYPNPLETGLCNTDLMQKNTCKDENSDCFSQVSNAKVPLSSLTTSATRIHDYNRKPVVDCQVSEWSEFSSCSATCGKSRKERRRRIEIHSRNGGKRCPNKLVQRRKCRNIPKCR
ncbi:spondin-1-like isoform X2 [Limulus polyphemus]|uniref:Spondin-1 n=1 Tax=Limulus polyphemus TaxID=6850 RepID=A0ABM1T6S7_LIMPO|nr:spondin-1-like isoform X2 [Limulus polyphemus]